MCSYNTGRGRCMWETALWGGIAGSAVLMGALAGIYLRVKRSIIAYIMAYGTGVLIGAATFELLIYP